MAAERYLIVNADDFGRSRGINGGVIRAHEKGIVTSASLMVRYPASVEAADYASRNRHLSVGLHLDLGEWVCRDWDWTPLYQVVPPDNAVAVRHEVLAQLAIFDHLMGCAPSHIDSHQHIHRQEPVRTATLEAANQLGIPLRDCTTAIRYCGRFYGQTAEGGAYPQGISVDALIRMLAEMTAGVTEVGCHPGFGQDLETMYSKEREDELKVLCDTRVQSAVADLGIHLCSFRDVSLLLGRQAKN